MALEQKAENEQNFIDDIGDLYEPREELTNEIISFLKQRFKDLYTVKKIALTRAEEVIENYSCGYHEFGGNVPNLLFSEIVEHEIFEYHSIEKIKPVVQNLQDIIFRIAKARRRHGMNDEFDDEWDVSDEGIFADELELGDSAIPDEYALEKDDYLVVSWNSPIKSWSFDSIFSSEALAWLSSDQGQKFLNGIDSEIEAQISDGKSVIELIFEQHTFLWDIEVGSHTFHQVPYPEQTGEILSLLKYKTKFYKDTDSLVKLSVTW